MNDFTIYDIQSAPEAAKPLLEGSLKDFGMVPNLHGVMAASPALLEGYKKLHDLAQQTSFNADELTVVWMAINVEHECHYCVPAHTAIAKSMGIEDKLLDNLRDQTPISDLKLEALREATLALLRKRGVVNDADLTNFFNAGYGQQQLLDIILILSQKVMSNYVNHLAHTPVDAPFNKFAWNK